MFHPVESLRFFQTTDGCEHLRIFPKLVARDSAKAGL